MNFNAESTIETIKTFGTDHAEALITGGVFSAAIGGFAFYSKRKAAKQATIDKQTALCDKVADTHKIIGTMVGVGYKPNENLEANMKTWNEKGAELRAAAAKGALTIEQITLLTLLADPIGAAKA